MAQPPSFFKRAGLQAVAHCPEEALEDCERELGAGLTIRGGADGHLGQMAQRRAGSIPVEHLDEKELDSGDRIEEAIAPGITNLVTGGQDGGGLELRGPLLLELFDDLRDGSGDGESPV